MRFPLFIAGRYLLSRNSPNVVNIITAISILGITLGTAALIVVLSVFNGFNALIRELYKGFDPDVQIVAKRGKYLKNPDSVAAVLQKYPNLVSLSGVVEGKAILEYNHQQTIVRLKGVDKNYKKVTQIDSLVTIGKPLLEYLPDYRTIVLGRGVAERISATLNDIENPMELYTVTEAGELAVADPSKALNKVYVVSSGFFYLQQKDYDEHIVLCDLELARNLFEAQNRLTSLELKLKDAGNVNRFRAELSSIVGADYEVKSWFEQHETLYQVMRNEKAVGFLIITFMLALASFNVVGSLTMIALDKKKDIGMLMALGASPRTIRNIFLTEGFLIGGVGGLLGAAIGFALCTLQEHYHLFKLGGGEDFVVQYWPVEQQPLDYLFVFLTVFFLSLLSGLYPATKAAKDQIMANIRQ